MSFEVGQRSRSQIAKAIRDEGTAISRNPMPHNRLVTGPPTTHSLSALPRIPRPPPAAAPPNFSSTCWWWLACLIDLHVFLHVWPGLQYITPPSHIWWFRPHHPTSPLTHPPVALHTHACLTTPPKQPFYPSSLSSFRPIFHSRNGSY
jgi:hypothetical protein